jgi:DNA-binding transcriptional ArsR family regulator
MARPGIHVDDPSALRALAHPLRLRILGTLRADGPQSVGSLARTLDVAPGSVSYHVATLEKHGFVVEAPELARNGRERWWRATAESTAFDPVELSMDPDRREAGQAFRRTIVQAYANELQRYLDTEESLDAEWIAAGVQGDSFAWLTPRQLREFSDAAEELARRFGAASDRDQPGARATRLIYASFRRP